MMNGDKVNAKLRCTDKKRDTFQHLIHAVSVKNLIIIMYVGPSKYLKSAQNDHSCS